MKRVRNQSGFSLIEIMIALALLGIGMAGIIGLQRVSTTASGYSRRATEAAILAEDKLESLRTVVLVDTDDDDVVDSDGTLNDDGLFHREWTFETVGTTTTITVAVTWNESDGEHTVRMRTLRQLP